MSSLYDNPVTPMLDAAVEMFSRKKCLNFAIARQKQIVKARLQWPIN